MSSWKQWHSMQNEEATTYGKLKTLIIKDCDELVGDLPRLLPSLIIKLVKASSYSRGQMTLEANIQIASPYVEKLLFNGENESSVKERLFKLQSTFNTLAAVRFEVENKRIKNPGVEKWLDDLLDAVDDAEDFFGDVEYDAMKPNKADESKKEKRKAISKLLSCFSKPSTSTDRVRNANMEEILKRLEYLANQIGNLNLEKNVVDVQPSGSSRVKTSLPDEPELYVSTSFFVKSKDRSGRSVFLMHDLLVDLAKIVSGKYSSLLEHNEDTVKFEKKTRHLGCLMEHSTNNKVSSYDFEGKIFPNWVGNDSFSNIAEVTLDGCEHCSYLPPFGQLPLLKDLSISRCNSVVTVGAEFYGNCSGRKPFSSLETLSMAELVIEAFLSASFDFLLEKITSPYVEDFFFKGKNESSSVVSERLFKLKSTFNCLAAVCIEVENKRIKNPAVEKWLDNLLDAVDDAEDFFGDIEYDAMKPKNVELKKEKRKAISKLLSCCSKPSNSADCERNAKMEAILKRLEHLADQIGKLNLEKNVGEVKPSESSRAKTSLPDEPELYVDLARTISGKYSCLLEQTDNIDRLEKKTRHLGCVKELYADNKIASYDFGATPISVSDGKSLEELTFLLIENCGSFVSFPNGGLIAPKLSDLQIFNCPKLKWLPEKMTSLSSLKSLTIIGCPLIETSPENGMPASFFQYLFEIASPYVKDFFFNGENERLFKLKSTFNSLAAVRFEVENKRIKNPAVEKWLDNLLDAVDDAEDFFGDIEYDAMKPNKVDESKKEKQKAISKLLSCFSKPSHSIDRARNGNMEETLKRLEYLANQIRNLNLEKNVVEVKPSESSRVKTSLPDEPELYVSMSFFVKSWDRRGSSCFVIHDLLVDLAKIVSGKYSSLLEHNEDIVTFEKKTRHLGCVMEHSSDTRYLDCPLIEPFPGGEGGLPVSLSTDLDWNMAELVISAVISASFDFLLKRVASPYLKEFLKENESSVVSERLFKLKSMLNCLAAVRFEVENKRIKNPAVEKWLDDLLDAIDDAEDFFGDIEYDAMKPNNVDESKKARGKARCLPTTLTPLYHYPPLQSLSHYFKAILVSDGQSLEELTYLVVAREDDFLLSFGAFGNEKLSIDRDFP
ncbi:hypothetical protein G4B88_023202 [Cannabis sativa]|uniref:Rx N-terminal domain-containing protein n=1 Tax=Cannabis sativa TaxID=3483 RepID=A0A7J6EHB8_CANSA|nr:hypothetical protein G4B88_023202 [Cannabis sativa]